MSTPTASRAHRCDGPFPLPGVSTESYLRAINRFPTLSLEDETRLARRFHETGDFDAARQLVLAHLRIVPAMARAYMGYGLPQEDLIQEGNVGLMKAVRRFDPQREVRFVSFALHSVKAEIQQFVLRNARLVRIATTKGQRKLFFNLRRLKRGIDCLSQADIARIAQELGVKPEEVAEMEERFASREVGLEPEDEERGERPVAWLPDPHANPGLAAEQAQYDRLAARELSNALHALDPRSRHIIEARWLREKERSTLHELAGELNVSAERVRQLEVRALRKMKGMLVDGGCPAPDTMSNLLAA